MEDDIFVGLFDVWNESWIGFVEISKLCGVFVGWDTAENFFGKFYHKSSRFLSGDLVSWSEIFGSSVLCEGVAIQELVSYLESFGDVISLINRFFIKNVVALFCERGIENRWRSDIFECWSWSE